MQGPSWTLSVAVVSLIMGLVLGLLLTQEMPGGPATADFPDWIASLLSGIAVLLTVLTILFSVLALLGWSFLKAQLLERAEKSFATMLLDSEQVKKALLEQLPRAVELYLEKNTESVTSPLVEAIREIVISEVYRGFADDGTFEDQSGEPKK